MFSNFGFSVHFKGITNIAFSTYTYILTKQLYNPYYIIIYVTFNFKGIVNIILFSTYEYNSTY